MTDLAFEFHGHQVRTAGTFDAPLFCAADVCAILGLDDTSRACERLDPADVHEVAQKQINPSSSGRGRPVLCVNESGLYELILGSRKAEARAFKRWVTSDVLPAIRKRGYYSLLDHQIEEHRKRLLAEHFPGLPGPAVPLFTELIDALLRKFGWQPASGNKVTDRSGTPPWAKTLASLIYEWAIRIDGQQQYRRERNPHPNGSRLDHAMFSDVARESVREVCRTGVHIVKLAPSWEDWKHKMELLFGTKALQMPLMVPMLAPPIVPPGE